MYSSVFSQKSPSSPNRESAVSFGKVASILFSVSEKSSGLYIRFAIASPNRKTTKTTVVIIYPVFFFTATS